MTKTDLWTTAEAEANWVTFELRARPNSAKLDKVPMDPTTGGQMSLHEARMTFEEAREAAEEHNTQQGVGWNQPGSRGVGYVPRPGSALVGVDIDNAFAPDGALKPDIAELIEDGETYLEKSPSGTGLRGLLERCPGDDERDSAERNEVGIFGDGKKFFSVTGDTFGPDCPITKAPKLRQKVLDRRDGGNAAQAHHVGGAQTPQQPASHPWGILPPSEREAALRDALTHVEPVDDQGDYDDGRWQKLSAAIHSAGRDLGPNVARSIFDDWCDQIGGDTSQNDKRWSSFDASRQGGATVATIFSEARARGWSEARFVFGPIPAGGGGQLLSGTAVGHGVLVQEPPEPEVLVQGVIPCGPFVWVGAGGAAKTTTAIKLLVNIVLGRHVWGRSVRKPGPVVMLSREDPEEVFRWRLHQVCAAMALSQQEQQDVAEGFYFEDLTDRGEEGRLLRADRDGNFTEGPLLQAIVDIYRPINPSLVLLDPAIQFGPGERHVNDGEAAMHAAAWKLSRGLNGAAVGLIHHVGQEVARSRTFDQYAGRGGTAGADNARAVLVQHSVKECDADMPQGVPPHAVMNGRVSEIRVEKFSYGPRPLEPFYVVRGDLNAFDLDFVPGNPPPANPAQQQARANQKKVQRRKELTTAIIAQLRVQIENGEYPAKASIPDDLRSEPLPGGAKITRDECRSVLDDLIARGEVEEANLPNRLRHGRRQTFLRPAQAVEAD